jgi:hypothetical protein
MQEMKMNKIFQRLISLKNWKRLRHWEEYIINIYKYLHSTTRWTKREMFLHFPDPITVLYCLFLVEFGDDEGDARVLLDFPLILPP